MPLDISSPYALGSALLGVALVLAGRRLFWLFVGAVGFLAGVQFAPLVVPPYAHGPTFLIGLGLGVLGALLSIIFQRLAVAAAGWMAGGLLAVRLDLVAGWHYHGEARIAFLIGAIFAAVLFSALFDWTLVVITSLVGALLVVNGAETATSLPALAIAAVLVVIGIAVQSRALEAAGG